MVQGLPAVDWKKPENNAKLFAAVLAMIPGTPDYKQIAKVFGGFTLVVCVEFCWARLYSCGSWTQIPQHDYAKG